MENAHIKGDVAYLHVGECAVDDRYGVLRVRIVDVLLRLMHDVVRARQVDEVAVTKAVVSDLRVVTCLAQQS